MIPEIEFRAWNVEEQKMIEWHEHFFYDTSPVTNWSGSFESIDQDNMKLMQYIGLKDRDGKKAFYKDIVEYDGWKYVIEWDNYDTGFYLADYKYLDDPLSEEHRICSCVSYGTILGDIYRNPELIASK